MLGNGCPWKNQCQAQDRYNKREYCDTISSWQSCPHRPANHGNREIERRYHNKKSSDSSASFGQMILLVVFIMWILSLILS